ncbi:MAG: hypothetical protein ACRBEE_12460 [Arenicella sp.]
MVKLPTGFTFNALSFELENHLKYLTDYHKEMEGQLVKLNTEYKENFDEWMSQEGVSKKDQLHEIMISSIEYTFEDKFSQILREQILTSIYGLIESSFFSASEFLRKEKNKQLALKDIAARSPEKRWKKYFSHILEIDLNFDQEVWTSIKRMREIRNVLVHTGGIKGQISDSNLKKLKEIVKHESGLTISSYEIEIEPKYLNNQFDVASKVVNALVHIINNNGMGVQ